MKVVQIYTSLSYLINSYVTFFFFRGVGIKNSISIFLTPRDWFFIFTHIRLSTSFFSIQVLDFFSYELPSNQKKNDSIVTLIGGSMDHSSHLSLFSHLKNSTVSSSTTLFSNLNWLERELAEMHGVTFYGKEDLRNLMLPYGDGNAPLQKILPSIGTRELYYDWLADSIILNNVSVQF